jgi:hypothetical protein
MASSILRNDSAWFSSRVLNCSLSSLVRPSTSSATGEPKRSISSILVMPQSSSGVVQQRGHQGLGVELPLGALHGHGDRVGDVGFAAVAQLAQVGLVGKAVGQPHLLKVSVAEQSSVRPGCAKLLLPASAAAGIGCRPGVAGPVAVSGRRGGGGARPHEYSARLDQLPVSARKAPQAVLFRLFSELL